MSLRHQRREGVQSSERAHATLGKPAEHGLASHDSLPVFSSMPFLMLFILGVSVVTPFFHWAYLFEKY